MRAIALLTFLFICTITFAQRHNSGGDKRFAGLDTAFARVLKEWHAAGFAVAVVEKNKIVYAKGYGYREVENKFPVTPNTVFAIGSCTKAFTASLLGLLNKDDLVDFDKPVRNYLPGLKFYNDEMNDKITLRDVMCHRTGLPRHDYSWYLFQTKSRDSLVQRIQYMEPSAGLREKWQYNNFMFMLQGVVAEKLTHKSWEENIREKIFAPLEMRNSDLSINDMIKNSEAATGYYVKNDSIIDKMDYYHIDAMGPAGSINSTVNDMANWVITWVNGGKFNGKEIIPASYIPLAITPQMTIGSGLPTKEKPDVYFADYGFAWVLSSYRGHYRVEHGGNIDGFSASTSFFPSDSIGIIVLCNQNNSAVPSVVRNLIADRMLGLKYFNWQSDQKSAIDKIKATAKEAEKNSYSSQKPNTKASHEWKDYQGIFSNKGYGSFEVTLLHDSLFAILGSHTFWLRHHHYDVFLPIEKDSKKGIDTTDKGQLMQFNMNITGDIESVSISFEPSVKPIVFTKTPKPKEITKEELQQYTGEYELSGITMKIFIKGDETLYLFVPGQPEYELVPIDKDKFSIKTLNGFTVQFNRNAGGDITELLSIQPNGTFKAIRKK
jgi:CubicO group peptidase (beta-lactamase class C family)